MTKENKDKEKDIPVRVYAEDNRENIFWVHAYPAEEKRMHRFVREDDKVKYAGTFEVVYEMQVRQNTCVAIKRVKTQEKTPAKYKNDMSAGITICRMSVDNDGHIDIAPVTQEEAGVMKFRLWCLSKAKQKEEDEDE